MGGPHRPVFVKGRVPNWNYVQIRDSPQLPQTQEELMFAGPENQQKKLDYLSGLNGLLNEMIEVQNGRRLMKKM
uniref:Uncharacterized protein n=1 Tax=Plectus sambesii TaxID=2011161 RepID=A0A914WF49_9BILA